MPRRPRTPILKPQVVKSATTRSLKIAKLIQEGLALHRQGKLGDAKRIYEKIIQKQSDHFDALHLLGVINAQVKQYKVSLQFFDKALQINKTKFEVFNNRGNVLFELKRLDEALTSYDEALRIKPDYLEALSNRGITLRELKRLEDALKNDDEALRIKPDYEFLHGIRQHTRMKLCVWTDYEESVAKLETMINAGAPVSTPFAVLGLIDDPKVQRRCSETYIAHKQLKQVLGNINKSSNKKDKPRIGYFSADFHNHATLHLMLEVFKNHDNSRFDFYAFSFGPETNDSWQQEAKSCFKEFINVKDISDTKVAERSRQLGIDIAVDLKGFTQGFRPGIFANRAASIQINYLGYPGTLGADFMDYIIADRIVIPAESRQFYTEKVLYLPNCYQPNIRTREVSEKEISRKEMGLPQDGIVYCSFNNTYKITPQMFSIWLEILKGVDKSVLWILCNSETVKQNLIEFANAHRVASSRIIFASYLPVEEHLKRLPLADVFLDTYPYNAHTTASDAVRVGVPIVTLVGQSFASRVAASILAAVNMSELVANTPQDYKNLAIRLGSDRNYLQTVSAELKTNFSHSSLIDSVTFTKDLENIYLSLLRSPSVGVGGK
jgi:protein O-GlcNAc transferase